MLDHATQPTSTNSSESGTLSGSSTVDNYAWFESSRALQYWNHMGLHTPLLRIDMIHGKGGSRNHYGLDPSY